MEDIQDRVAVNVSPSATWKRPSDVMKMRRKKKGGQQGTELTTELKHNDRIKILDSAARRGKRRNPFSFQSESKRSSSTTSLDESNDVNESTRTSTNVSNKLMKMLDVDLDKDTNEVFDVDKSQHYLESVQNDDSATKVKENNESTSVESQVPMSSDCPVDWSLKTRVLFLSPNTFDWFNHLKTAEECDGLKKFVTCQPYKEVSDVSEDLHKNRAEVYQCLLSWIHPNLPWVKLFPRIATEFKQPSKIPATTQGIQDSLTSDWSESFHSAFHMVRSKQCAFFYMCTYQYTILFRAAGMAGNKHMTALITPTTKGLRETLKNEGIDFEMPLSSVTSPKSHDTPSTASDSSQHVNKANSKHVYSDEESDDEDQLQSADDDGSSWLQSMGLNQRLSTADSCKVKVQDKTSKSDHHSQSMVCIQGAYTQALFNFLLNSKGTTAMSGPQAGVPPTILAPVAFQGATLKTLKVKHGRVHQLQAGQSRFLSSFEVTGPLLPTNIVDLCNLFKVSQKGDYRLTCNVQDNTVPFNAATSDHGEHNEHNTHRLSQCGLSSQSIDNFMQCSNHGNQAIRELQCDNGMYTWKL